MWEKKTYVGNGCFTEVSNLNNIIAASNKLELISGGYISCYQLCDNDEGYSSYELRFLLPFRRRFKIYRCISMIRLALVQLLSSQYLRWLANESELAHFFHLYPLGSMCVRSAHSYRLSPVESELRDLVG